MWLPLTYKLFSFSETLTFQGKGIQIEKHYSFLFEYLHVLASISLHHQKKEYLRLPGYSVLSKSHSLSVSIFQHSSRDHYKHRETKVGLNSIPMLLSDLHTGKRWQRLKGFPTEPFHVQNKRELSYFPAAQYSVEITDWLSIGRKRNKDFISPAWRTGNSTWSDTMICSRLGAKLMIL